MVSQRHREGSSQQSQLPQSALDIAGSRIGVYHVCQWDELGRLLCQSLESKTVVDEEIKTPPRHLLKSSARSLGGGGGPID